VLVDRLQRQRFELKYIVSESKALAVRDFVGSYLELDPYGGRQPNKSYPVHSLYLDSPDLSLYRATINGERNRFKLRVRFYEIEGNAPVSFEIKRRCNNVILKSRARVRRGSVARLLNGDVAHWDDLAHDCNQELKDLQEFLRLCTALQAAPKAHVKYLREAWESPCGNSLRVTMDRCVHSAPEFTARLDLSLEESVPLFEEGVILELKYTDRFPRWLQELVQAFDLRTASAAKYVDGVQRLNPSRLTARHVVYV
jgi:hypothetical protein